jgi:surface protein
MFSSCKSLSNISALKNWNVSSVKYCNGMFQNCSSFNYIDNIQNWDISNISDFSFCVENCKISNTYHLEKWKVQK